MPSLHVMSANLQQGKPSRRPRPGTDKVTWQRESISKAIRQITAAGPDLLALQELKVTTAGGDLYAPLLAAGNYHEAIFAPTKNERGRLRSTKKGQARGVGTALLSVYPIGAREVINLPVHQQETWLKTLRTNIGIGEIPRVAILAEIKVAPGYSVVVAATHLTYTYRLNVTQLRTVAGALAGFAQRHGLEKAPRLIIGDLNIRGCDVPLAATGYEAAAEALTYPSDEPESQIDHILGTGVDVRAAENLFLPLSDHRALRATAVWT
ncbi:endonuclease/exonuclease/phosphatase family protein [Actinotignum sanguinis]|uniref:Endonuclease/exonuclease/phosphatase family protein n=2 Tax=Actinomycetaceae TaxID=2049 RepID=A0ABZ0RC84_9ACTO|nr:MULTISPECIES: endonuclease/exonuclease/phosphatase family protein [Actinotignum]MDK6787947.1 endonuclease/exonuclease/phosphatase family protein [Actinotignum timonense]WPJ88665.1 endonuclease/exonuclease/phosphatase family protein [Schaalia turicensis]MDE1552522.1 endonuclease/exonuclease/phosphatase family protein [Actinotignum sanguinis]MDE1566071.1 endonuclease/exonuclease/phosphatase family protein [Actinotignum sanguinis]MDE1576971.1 endonuclease/exonuclease/phosphatase family protein